MKSSLFEHTKAKIHEHTPSIRYAVDADMNLILEEWRGEVTSDALGAHWAGFLNNPDVMSCRRTIVDLTDAVIKFNGDELSFLVKQLVTPKLGGQKWITAIIVASPLQHGISRQYGVYADYYSKDMIFTSYDEAKKWIDSSFHKAE